MKELSIFSTNFFPEPPPRTEVSFFTILYLNKKLLEQKKVVHALVKKQKRAIYLAPYFLELHFDLGGRSITKQQNPSPLLALAFKSLLDFFYKW